MKLISKGFLVVVLFACASCVSYQVLSSAELEQRGTKLFPSTSLTNLSESSAIALKSLGYNVVQQDCNADECLIKTSPKNISTTASTTATYSTAATHFTEDGLAWQLSLKSQGKDVLVKALPKAFRNGSVMNAENTFVAEVMDPKFNDLWTEINSSQKFRN